MKNALLKLEEAQKRLRRLEEARIEPVAMVGMACRFPGGVRDPESYWELLEKGIDAIGNVPGDRWNNQDYYDADPEAPGKVYTQCGGFIDSPRDFDAEFFNVSPREAASLDPQQRILLEVSWEALEHAGIAADQLAGSPAGVFIGICTHDYGNLLMSQDPAAIDAYLASGTSHSVAAGRLSYFLGLEGPSLAVDTACSSSLVAVHLACQSLRNRECSVALAGGVNRILSPEFTINFCKARMLAPDGRCKTFDASADGFVRSEGCGIVVLKRLSDALAAGDNILALIPGSAVNQDGRTSGLTVPHGPSQRVVIRQALKNAGVEPCEVSYVEAHGTGTALGDPIEMGALGAVYGKDRAEPLLVASVKTNIGHLEAAAGIAGLIKAVLVLQHQGIPRHLHFRIPNPLIPWREWAVEVPGELKPWPAGEVRRIAGVSSFGFSGTNAHVIIEEAPAISPCSDAPDRPFHLLTVSGRTDEALSQSARRMEKYLDRNPETSFADICFSSNAGRTHFEHRLSLVASSSEEARKGLARFSRGETNSSLVRGKVQDGRPPKIAFLFTGQGAQYAGMGRQFFETQPLFRKTLEECADLLGPFLEKPLLEVLYPDDDSNSRLDQTGYTQPALFALQYALAAVWKSWGILPATVMGHGAGEYAAACVAGVFSLKEGCMLVAERSRLMQSLPDDGGMTVVFAAASRVSEIIKPYGKTVAIAAVNGPKNTVISGSREAIADIANVCRAAGLETRPLNVSRAFHSPLMDPIAAGFRGVAERVVFAPPRLGLIANLTGELANGEISTPEYWVDHIRKPVQFSAGMAALEHQNHDLFVEIGPRPTLLGMGRQCWRSGGGSWLPSLRPDRSEWLQMLESLAELYAHGVSIHWPGFERDYHRRRVVLPAYPFQRQPHWIKESQARLSRFISDRKEPTLGHPLLGRPLISPLETIQFESKLSSTLPSFLHDHCVFGKAIVPMAAYIEMALSAASRVLSGRTLVLEELVAHRALLLSEKEPKTVQFLLDSGSRASASFRIASLEPSDRNENGKAVWTLHATGNVRGLDSMPKIAPMDLGALRQRCLTEQPVSDFYRKHLDRGVAFGPSFQAVQQIYVGEGEALGRIDLPKPDLPSVGEYLLHPVLLDACCQVVGAVLPAACHGKTFLQTGVERVRLVATLRNSAWSFIRLRPIGQPGGGPLIVDVTILDESGVVLAELAGISLLEATRELVTEQEGNAWKEWLYEIEWMPQLDFDHERLPLPSPSALLPELNRWLEESQGRFDSRQYGGLLSRLEGLSVRYIVSALSGSGAGFSGQPRFTFEQLIQKCGIIPRHRHLLGRLLSILEEEGFLRLSGSQWEWIEIPIDQEADAQWKSLLAQFPSAKAEIGMLGRCGARLAGVMRGECEPLELLFLGDKGLTAADIYQHSPGAKLMNGLVQSALLSVLSRLPKGKALRILEIGAGTGGTTAAVLPVLPARQTQYDFTDISAAFLTEAREKFSDYPFVRYRILDIEDPPAKEELQHYDLVIAANVLHATRQIRETLGHIQRLLVPGGLLFLLESTAPRRWADLIFGLTEGWWRFADEDLRPSHPLLSVNQWQQVLEDTRFQKTAGLVPGTEETEVLCQQALFLTQAPQRELESPGSGTRHWLIFADALGVGSYLQKQLEAVGDVGHMVFPGDKYQVTDPTTYRINPLEPAHFQQLLGNVARATTVPLSGVVHLWSMDAASSSGLTLSQLNDASANGCGSALHLVQALLHARFSPPPSLCLVTGGVHARSQARNGPGPEIAVAQAPLWGLGKAIALEHPEIRCRLIDVEPGVEAVELRKTAARLCEEIRGNGSVSESQVAYQNGERHVPRLKRITADAAQPRLCLRPDATYLITGGLGSVGLLVARWMVDHGARNLVLMGRREPDARSREACQSLERRGARISVIRADVSLEGEVRSMISRIQSSLPPLRGILHSAGVFDDRLLRVHQWELFERVFAPKVSGSWNLHMATIDLPLDFFILFSSLASLFGASGLANYIAANTFLDALAHYRRQLGLPGSSINWGVWKKMGMANSVGARRESQWAVHGIQPMEPKQALDALEMLLAANSVQAGVLLVDWERYLSRFPGAPPTFFESMVRTSSLSRRPQGAFLDRLKAAPPDDQRALLTAHVRFQVAGVLGLPQSEAIDPTKGFFEMGMDSLTSMELRNRLQASLNCPLPSTLIFKYPKVSALAEYLALEALSLKPRKPAGSDVPPRNEPSGSLDDLSQEELANRLSLKLASMNGAGSP